MKCDRFVGTGNKSVETGPERTIHPRTLRGTVSASGCSVPSKTSLFVHSVTTLPKGVKQRSRNTIKNAINPNFEEHPSSNDDQTQKNPSPSLSKRNSNDDTLVLSCTKENAKKPMFVTFEDNTKFQIPIIAQVHHKNNTSIQNEDDEAQEPVIQERKEIKDTNSVIRSEVNLIL